MGTLTLQPTSVDVPSTYTATYTTPLRAAIVAGGQIKKADIDLLNTFIDLVVAHSHTLTDQLTLKDFGDGAGGSNTSAADVTSVYTTYTPISIAVGNTILASHQNTMATGANAMISHNHTFTDNP